MVQNCFKNKSCGLAKCFPQIMRYVFFPILKNKNKGKIMAMSTIYHVSCIFSHVMGIDTTRDLIEYPWSVSFIDGPIT